LISPRALSSQWSYVVEPQLFISQNTNLSCAWIFLIFLISAIHGYRLDLFLDFTAFSSYGFIVDFSAYVGHTDINRSFDSILYSS
jgi:hypothetical protein